MSLVQILRTTQTTSSLSRLTWGWFNSLNTELHPSIQGEGLEGFYAPGESITQRKKIPQNQTHSIHWQKENKHLSAQTLQVIQQDNKTGNKQQN